MPAVHAFDVLGDPVRRRILELLATGERAAGDVGAAVQAEFGITQSAVSQHLKVLRSNGFVQVRPEGARRVYAVAPDPLQEIDAWLDHFRQFWEEADLDGPQLRGRNLLLPISGERVKEL